MSHFVVTAAGRDRIGIIAAITKVLLDHQMNIGDARTSVLWGEVAMSLVVSGSAYVEAADLQRDLDRVRERLELEAVTVRAVPAEVAESPIIATHEVRVHGLDRPGITFAVCRTLADCGASIVHLSSGLVGEDGGEPMHAMTLQVALADAASHERLRASLASIVAATEIDISLRALDAAGARIPPGL